MHDLLDFSVDTAHWPAAALQQRVVITTGSYDHAVDGVALTLNRLASHLLRHGHEVLVLSPGRARRRPVLRHAGTLVRVPSVPLPIWSEYRLTFGLGRRARAALAAFEPTVLHVAVQDALGHAAVRWAEAHGVPVLCSHHTRWNAYLAYYALGRGLRAPLESLMWWGMRRFHGWCAAARVLPPLLLPFRVLLSITRLRLEAMHMHTSIRSGRGMLLGRCAATYPPSESVAQELRQHGVPRVGVWPRGVDRQLFRPEARSEAWRADVLGAAAAGPGTPPCASLLPLHRPALPRRHSSQAAFCPGTLGCPLCPDPLDCPLCPPLPCQASQGAPICPPAPCPPPPLPRSGTAVVLFVARLRWEKGLAALAAVLEGLTNRGVPHVGVVVRLS